MSRDEHHQAMDRSISQGDGLPGALVDRSGTRTKLTGDERTVQGGTNVLADPDQPFEAQLHALFELGCERFDLEFGAMARIDVEADQFEVEHVSDDDGPFHPGLQLPLSETFCTAAADVEAVASVSNPDEVGYDGITVYEEYGLRTYLGTYLHVDAGPDRTFFFVSSEPRDPFSDDERAFQQLMGQRVSYELQRQQRERQLRRQEAFTTDVLDALDDVFYVLDERGNLDQWNETTRQVTGYSADELESKDAREFFEGKGVTAAEDAMVEAFETGTVRLQADLVTKDGESIPYEFVASVLECPAGEPVLAGIGRDVSDRIQRERALREEYNRFASLFESIPEAAVNARFEDGELVVRATNSSFDATFGYDADEIVGEPLNDHIVPNERMAEAKQLDDLAVDRRTVAGEVRREATDGMRDFLLRAKQFERDDGTVEGIGVYVDVTERKRREQELELFRNLLDRSNDAVFVIDPDDGRFLDANDTASRRLGYDRERLLSLSVPDVERGVTVDEAWAQNVSELRADGTATFESALERRDGTTFPVEVDAVYVDLDRDYVLAVARDVTERKERERSLRRLYETTTDANLGFEAKIERLLELGRERFGFEYGFLTRIDGETLEMVEIVGGGDEFQPGSTVPLSEMYCREVHRRSEPVGVADATAEDREEDPAYATHGFESYLGTAITAGNETYGTLCFESRTPRDRPFTDAEYTFLELMGQWVSYELEREHREAQLGGLNEMGRDLMDAGTSSEIAERAVEHARSTLELPLTALVSYDEASGELSTAAQTPEAADELPTAALCDPEMGALWEAFVANETRILEDVDGDDLGEVAAVPLDRVGMFVTATQERFSDAELDFVKTTASTVEAACDRSRRERELQERERTLENQNETLERLNRVNDIIRNIDQALVGASTRGEIETVVCEQLADVGPYELAWIGDHDPVAGDVTPCEWTGTEEKYLDRITVDDGSGGEGPARRAIRTRERQVINDVLGDRSFEQWRKEALNHGYHATISLPLVYEDTLYGVLNVYASQPGVFDELERSVLAELSDTIAYAINAAERKKALVSNEVTELEFEVRDTAIAAVDLASRTGCTFSWQSLVPLADGGFRGFFTTRGVDADTVLSFVRDRPVGDVTLVAERDDEGERACLFEILLGEENVCGYVLEHGGNPRTIQVVDGVATVVVELAADAPVREFVDAFQTRYPDSDLLAQRTSQRHQQTPTEFHIGLAEDLTARQREALETAYFSGYFERPRELSASEVAAAMDISQPTFNHHLRAAHRKLCRRLFESERVT